MDEPPNCIVVRGEYVLTMGPRGDIKEGAVAFDTDTGSILAVGNSDEIIGAFSEAHVVGDADGIVMPGFVNAHDHLSEGLISGIGETLNLYEWQHRLIYPVGPQLTRELAAAGAMLKCLEMAQSGITCVNDMFVHTNPGSFASLGSVDGIDKVGLRGVVSFGAHDISVPIPTTSLMEEHYALAERCAQTKNIGFRLGIATLHSQSDELLRASVDAAKKSSWRVHTHIAEVKEEITESLMAYGHNTIGRASAFGLLDIDTLYAHCIWVSEADIGLLAQHLVTVCHNPLANMILASGVCPVPRLRSAGIVVGLGTDGAASNDSHDMLQVLKCAALLQKVHRLDPLALTARDVVRMATIEGARALRLDDKIGSLEVGKQADVIRLSGHSARLAYIHDVYQQLVYCAGPQDVVDVWVAGQSVLTNGQLVSTDPARIVEDGRRMAMDLFEAANLAELRTNDGPVAELR
jgi:5-methylthioadenosine/S-adenosylhomocysteine deaminase